MGEIARLDNVRKLQTVMSAMPQFDGFKTEHRFANGMYSRAVWRPAGVVTVGKLHRHEHFSIVLEGEVAIHDGEKATHVKAGDMFVTPPGMKRSVVALTDANFMTVHRLPDPDERDLDKIEEALILPEESMPRLFNSTNKLIDPALTAPRKAITEGT